MLNQGVLLHTALLELNLDKRVMDFQESLNRKIQKLNEQNCRVINVSISTHEPDDKTFKTIRMTAAILYEDLK